MKYRLNKKFIVQTADQKIILFDSEESVLHTLNETASYILNGIKRSWDKERLLENLEEKFDINGKTASKDLNDCIGDLIKKKIIIEKK